MSETGHELAKLPDRMVSASMFDDIANWESRKVQGKISSSNERSGRSRSKMQTWLLVFLWSRIGTDVEF